MHILIRAMHTCNVRAWTYPIGWTMCIAFIVRSHTISPHSSNCQNFKIPQMPLGENKTCVRNKSAPFGRTPDPRIRCSISIQTCESSLDEALGESARNGGLNPAGRNVSRPLETSIQHIDPNLSILVQRNGLDTAGHLCGLGRVEELLQDTYGHLCGLGRVDGLCGLGRVDGPPPLPLHLHPLRPSSTPTNPIRIFFHFAISLKPFFVLRMLSQNNPASFSRSSSQPPTPASSSSSEESLHHGSGSRQSDIVALSGCKIEVACGSFTACGQMASDIFVLISLSVCVSLSLSLSLSLSISL